MRGRLIFRRKDNALLHQHCTISSIKNEAGEITHFVVVSRNITREVELEEQVHQVRTMEALAMLAGGIAHDLNNTLAIIIGRTEMSMQMLDERHPLSPCLDIIMRNATRSEGLVKRLLTFARQKTGVSGPLYVAPLLQGQLEDLRKRLPRTIFVKDSIDLESEVITAEPGAFERMVEGLVDNAVRAMEPEGGVLEITLKNVRVAEGNRVTTGTMAPGDYVLLRVSDTGCGMRRRCGGASLTRFIPREKWVRASASGWPRCTAWCFARADISMWRARRDREPAWTSIGPGPGNAIQNR